MDYKMDKKIKKSALIVCNAPLPPQALLQDLLRQNPTIICADGGADRLHRRGIEPHFIVGDLDSLSRRIQTTIDPEKLIKVSDQNSTDLEKALNFAIDRGISSVIVIGAMGGRSDHTFANFSILLKYHDKIRIEYLDTHGTMRIITAETVLNLPKGTTISLMPLGICKGIETEGLAYPLKNESLQLGVREGLSNVVTSSPVRIRIRKGFLLLFILYKHHRAKKANTS